MSEVLIMEAVRKLGKLHGRSARELRVRGSQLLQAFAERRGWSSQGRVPSDANFFGLIDSTLLPSPEVSAGYLLQHFRTRITPRFFPSFYQKQETFAELRARFASNAVIESALRISAGRFDLLGLNDLDFGVPINWHLEPVSGVVAPNKHWSQIAYLDAAEAGDKKITWELNRHSYFSTLGRAYWRTQDELYAETFAAHINSWIDANPPKMGINWASSLEVAFRSISWLWALYFFKDSKHLTPSRFVRIIKLLYLHGRHLETYLSTYFSPNTHLTGEALGLFYLGTLLPEFHCAERWRAKGSQILLGELDRHIRQDGVYFEQSSYYHRYTTDFYIHFLILSVRNGATRDTKLQSRLQALLDHLMYITRPDGTTSLFGDDDGGRLMMLDERAADDFRAPLSTGATLFQRPDYKYVAGEAAEETLWLLGPEGLQAFDELVARQPAEESKAFQESGYYVMRDGWSSESNFLLLDCGPHGSLRYGHAHADVMGFELAAHGRTMLVDSGTYTYTGSPELRDYFRSSAAHNTLTIDDQSSSVPDGPFSWKHVATAQSLNRISRPRFDFFEGKHDGYERLDSPASHTRAVLFVKGDYWVILDDVSTAGAHRYKLHFHFSPDTFPSINSGDGFAFIRERPEDLPGLDVCVCDRGGKWEREEGWISKCYGKRSSAPVFTFTLQSSGAQKFVTFLFPRQKHQNEIHVHELETREGRAFEVFDGVKRDVLVLGSGERAEAGQLTSDFRLAWLRFTGQSTDVDELISIGGRHLALDGQEIVSASEFREYIVASRLDDDLLGESDQREWRTNLPKRQPVARAL